MRKGKKVILILVSIVLIVSIVTAVANTIVVKTSLKQATSYNSVDIEKQLVPEKDENGNWVFTTDREFKIMHLTDIHLGGGYMSASKDAKAIEAVAAMITREKPDLVIATGDIAYPVPVQSGTFNNKSGAEVFAELMETLGVYWTVTLGNHDSELYSYFNRQKISDFYSDDSLKYCLYEAGPEDVDGYGNHVIEIKNTKGIITQACVMLDSHSYTDGDFLGLQWKYDNIHPNQVEWYKNEINRMNEENRSAIQKIQKAENGGLYSKYTPVKSLAFFHIPLVELKDAWTEFSDKGFKDTEDFKYIEGIIGETGKRIYPGVGEDDLFEAMLELGSTKAMFHGHDHYNNITVSYKDIIFSYGYSVDYLAYVGIAKEGSQRGCTVITAKPDSDFDIEKFNYHSGRYIMDGFENHEVEMQFEDVTYQVEE